MDETAKKSVAASVGAVITSFAITRKTDSCPGALEVVKTRLQVQAPAVVHAPPAVQKCPYYSFSNGLMDTMLPKQRLLKQCKCSPEQICSPPKPNSTLFTMARIVRLEGPLALYAGLPPTLLTAIPSTAHGARGAATIFSPFELIRVQMQAVANAHPFATYVHQVWQGGVRQLFAGLGATLARDIPFSAFYWYGIETSKEYLTERVPIADAQRRRVSVAFISGVLAGVLATVVTHPFDVIKTRSQLAVYSKDTAPAPSLRQLLRHMWEVEGARGMAAGLVPRVVKVAPACAIMISSYEATKQAFNVD
ncbi:Mitochondrial Carrier (MC) Family [Phytophthora cinnamomi]|uniref:Mitochondrial Carrier (MC) Family n=1 Tax=Phytophthora cinnamomi TaxID=4785 RepID=UPI00355A277F|nr:Mitochondrial Carrier (MC) Family [Phytophthora cinnamomi]